MRKAVVILLIGLLGCVAGFTLVYLAGTARSRAMLRVPQPELAWLKREFNLGDAEFARIVGLHRDYLPKCAARCQLIEEQNRRLRDLLSAAPAQPDEIKAVMAARAKLRSDCEAEMLEHFIAVSRTMPPEQGRRYLAWVEQQTFMRGEAMERQHGSDNHAHHH